MPGRNPMFGDAAAGIVRAAKLKAAANVEFNRTGIAKYRIVLLAGSGPMEKAIDGAIGRRFKLRG